MAKAIAVVSGNEVDGVIQKTFMMPTGDANLEGSGSLIGFGFESMSRVCAYTPSPAEATLSTITYPYIKTNGVQAFVNETMNMLQIAPDQNMPFRYVISPPKTAPVYAYPRNITHVEITGRLKFKPAVKETDLLLIDDLDALKLMMLALWREENNQMDLTKTLEAKAIEHLSAKTDSSIEIARKIAYQSSSSGFPYGTMGFVRSKLALDIKNGLRLDDGELIDLINKATDTLVSEYNFLLKNGRYGVKDNLSPLTHSFSYNDEQELPIQDYQVIRLAVMAIQANNANQPDAAVALKKEAIDLMEKKLAYAVETKRHSVYQTSLSNSVIGTLGYAKAKLALDIKNGLSFSDAELGEMVNKAQERLISEYNLLIKAGRYGVQDELPNLSYTFQSANNAVLQIPDYTSIRYMVLANLAISSDQPNSAAKSSELEAMAITKIEKNILTELETKRHSVYKNQLENAQYMSFAYLVSRISLDLTDGLKLSKQEVKQLIVKGLEKLAQHYNYLLKAGRFGVKSGIAPIDLNIPSFDTAQPPVPFRDYDLVKLMTTSVMLFNAGTIDASRNVEEQGYKKLEEMVLTDLESRRHGEYQLLLDSAAPNTYGHIKARLALELPNGLKLSDKELKELVVKAQEKLIRHYNFIIKAGRLGVKKPLPSINTNYNPLDSAVPPIKDYEAIKYAALSVSAVTAGQQEQGMILDKEAQNVLEQNLTTVLEADRHELYKNAISNADPDSFGYYKARAALDLPEGLRLSDDEIGRLINRAEETLIFKGKWPGTIDETKLTLPVGGNVYLPFNVETVLSAANSDGKPLPIYGRQYDYHENGPGYSTSDDNNLAPALIDRGDTFVDGKRVRVYFVRGNTGVNRCVKILYKRKFSPHLEESDKMFILNYPAILEMILALQTQASAPDVSKYHENNALQLLRAELQENQSGNRYNLKVQAKAFALSEVQSLV
jgi:hypothetical protein